MRRWILVLIVLSIAGRVGADDDVEFFEKRIRPVLAEHCYSCHSETSKKLKGGLKVDSRASLLKGGETGPAVVPKSPHKSLLLEAVSYKNTDLLMPPKAKLPDAVIADLEKWIASGAAWPEEKVAAKDGKLYDFDLNKRKREHWAWRPIHPATPPAGQGSPIDRFLDAKLAAAKLTPAGPAEPRVLLRRLWFDIVGLPPTPDAVREFEKACAVDRTRAVKSAVDDLLASPHFGERWGRHWLDLVRYAESRGHEFDYTLPNAPQYRDYVIRALNADVPYDQFVREHLAGDLLPTPRLNPEHGFNESILGTGFWFLGEQIHSPVDICQDRADRLDNQLDVMSKAFLGLTVACARCHDHKFDAISAKDYYALAGFLESGSYRLLPFESLEHNRRVSADLWKLQSAQRERLRKAVANQFGPSLASLDDFLEEARASVQKRDSTVPPERRAKLDALRVAQWVDVLKASLADRRDPLHAYACDVFGRPIAPTKAGEAAKVIVVVDYQSCSPEAWLPDAFAYGPGPIQVGMPNLTDARFATEAAAEFDPLWNGLKLTGDTEPGSAGRAMRPGRMIRTPKFDIEPGKIFVRLRGSGNIYAAVEGHTMIAGPLHGELVSAFKGGPEFRWHAIDLNKYAGRRVHLEFTPEGSVFGVAKVIQSATPPTEDESLVSRPETTEWDGATRAVAPPQHAAKLKARFAAALAAIERGTAESLDAHRVNWLLAHRDLFGVADVVSPMLKEFAAEQSKAAAAIKFDSRLAPAMLDGNGVNERVFIRGNYKTPGDVAPRRLLEALAGPEQVKTPLGSGRLELARQMTDPDANPFFTRVAVNRVWHHLFGRGLVGSVDNFGVLGETPTHPELLDALAEQFAKNGYSVKKLIREIVLTDAYQRSSKPSADAVKSDPSNLLLQHARVRRLEGEAIRDAILSVSGRLDPKMFGPSVPVHLTDFQQGRGRPGSGPLDGAGRRSVYLSVRRNFLSPMLLAFDTPLPFSTVGRRTVSNVPAQALILLNDPFVHQQSQIWAKRVLAGSATLEGRLADMYLAAYGRSPTDREMSACREFLAQSTNETEGWASLAHVLVNGKEFIFLE
jgi:hypothetical protein